ncbi:microfibril-associated glycoprotein 4-like [Sabethes cyaneus]|uniref:microfibril-associated glycoprotein 4-like n=1 Tax=Sabethes cyaneus TaxID=53552 RepID=UPI00237D9960|nr:microfibril-associated glycoprotein 4-like [Sabethes cyaneus]
MVVKFVLLPVLVVVAAIINTSTAESNESISNAPFAYELIVSGLETIGFNLQQNDFRVQKLTTYIASMGKTVKAIETVVSHSEKKTLPQTCAEISDRRSGPYRIQPQAGFSDPFVVYCDQEYEGGGWMIIQNRYDGSVEFFRGWKEYETGFGDLRGEYWLGMKKIYELTSVKPHELHIMLEDFDGKIVTALYDRFVIGGPETSYVLRSLGNYTGTAGDSLRHHEGMKFSAFDNDNDKTSRNCAEVYKGAWWYNDCLQSNLNGQYLKGQTESAAMSWDKFRGLNYGLKRSRMMIRQSWLSNKKKIMRID